MWVNPWRALWKRHTEGPGGKTSAEDKTPTDESGSPPAAASAPGGPAGRGVLIKVVRWVIAEGTSGLWERPGGPPARPLWRSLFNEAG